MIADAAHVRKVGNLPTSLGDAEITPHLRQAGHRIKRWVGSSAYSTSETEAAGLGTPRDFTNATEQTQDLSDAEAYLALSIGFSSWNTVMERAGGNAAGIAASGIVGDSTFRYLNPNEVEKIQKGFMYKAEQTIQPYISDDYGGGSPGPGRSFAIDDNGKEIDDDYPD